MITASFFTIEMRGKTENIHNTIFIQFTTFLSIMSLYGQSKNFRQHDFYRLIEEYLVILKFDKSKFWKIILKNKEGFVYRLKQNILRETSCRITLKNVALPRQCKAKNKIWVFLFL